MWLIVTIAAAFGNALWTAGSKPVVQDIPPFRMMLLFRVMLTAIFLLPFLLIRGLPGDALFWLVIAAIGLLQAARWVIIMQGVRGDYFSTYGMYNTAPLFTLLIAPTLLPERFGLVVWLGVLAIIAGGFLFYRTSRLSVYGLVGAVLTAFINTLSKHVLGQISPIVLLFLMQSSAALFLLLGYPFARRRDETPPRWKQEAARIAPLTLISAIAGFCFMYALSLDTATRVTAVVRTNLIFGFLLSYVMLKEKSQWEWKLAGTALILVGTIAVAL